MRAPRQKTMRWLALGMACAAPCIAGGYGWRQGWLNGLVGTRPADVVTARLNSRTRVAEYVEPELPSDVAEAQHEPDLDADGQDDTIELDDAGVIQVNFDDPSDPAADRTASRASGGPASADDAGDSVRTVPDPAGPPGKPADGIRLLEPAQIEALEDQGDYDAALRELSRWYWQKPSLREQLQTRLNKLAQVVYFHPQPPIYEPYIVQAGDQLRNIAQRHKVSWEYLEKLNRIEARKIRMGQRLKVIPGPFAAAVSLSRYELVIRHGDNYVKSYRVGIGKDGSTPVGTFVVKNKMVDPTYYGPEGVVAHDDPSNPLGERWIDIGDSYGIHGTIDPGSIGKSESRGCIRLLNGDVEEVYDFLVLGSEVKIQR